MKKKIVIFLCMIGICSCLTGCDNKHDHIDISNKTCLTADNIGIDIKDGYFYDKHEKFTVDENTVAVTIYFSTEDDDTWE